MKTNRTRALAAVAVLALSATVSVSAFALSFSALMDVAALAGVERSLAWLLPVCIDGAMVVGTAAWQWKHIMGCSWRGRAYPALIVLVGAGLSVWINALHADLHHAPALGRSTAMVVSALPALFLALSVHLTSDLVSSLLPRSVSVGIVSAQPEPVPVSALIEQPVPVSAPTERPTLKVVSTSAQPTEALTWVTDQVRAGAALTGKQVGERFGVSAQTGRRWLSSARTEFATSV